MTIGARKGYDATSVHVRRSSFARQRDKRKIMKEIAKLVVLGAALLLVDLSFGSSNASAQEPETTEFNFEDGDLVTGDLVRPNGELLNVRRRGRRSTLIRIREHFIPEMLKSVEDL
ncbi:MAG: hypothetical protein R3B40_20565 [Polyangiales bacterium]|nr:hypothetical protein [Sandaracinaceae bacterium]